MPDDLSFIEKVLSGAAASSVVVAAGWGALGGATAALTVKVSGKDAVRMIVTGGLVAGGGGATVGAMMAFYLSLSAEFVALAGAGASASYMVGVFGPAIFEVLLSRIRSGRLPTDKGGDDA